MPSLPVLTQAFDPEILSNTSQQVDFSLHSLVKAAVTAGCPSANAARRALRLSQNLDFRDLALSALHASSYWYGFTGSFAIDVIRRLSTLRLGLVVDTNYAKDAPGIFRAVGLTLRATQFLQSADPTEKAQISYVIGNTVCGLLADRLLQIPWITSLALCREKVQATFAFGNSRPDFVGRSSSQEWFAFESKGRSWSPDRKTRKRAKVQAAMLEKVGGAPVRCNIASFAFFVPDEYHGPSLSALWVDPPIDEPANAFELSISEDEFFRLYYTPLLLTFGYGTIEQEETISEGRLHYFPQLDAWIGIQNEVAEALVESHWSSLYEFAETHHGENEYPLGVRGYSDGVLLRLGPGWNEAEHQPVHRITAP